MIFPAGIGDDVGLAQRNRLHLGDRRGISCPGDPVQEHPGEAVAKLVVEKNRRGVGRLVRVQVRRGETFNLQLGERLEMGKARPVRRDGVGDGDGMDAHHRMGVARQYVEGDV